MFPNIELLLTKYNLTTLPVFYIANLVNLIFLFPNLEIYQIFGVFVYFVTIITLITFITFIKIFFKNMYLLKQDYKCYS